MHRCAPAAGLPDWTGRTHAKGIGGAEADRATRQIQTSGFFDQAFFQQTGHAGGGIYAAHLLNKSAGHRLVVGDDGQGLHGRRAKRHSAAAVQHAAHTVRPLGLGGKLPPGIEMQQAQTAVLPLVAGVQGLQCGIHAGLGQLHCLCQLIGPYGIAAGKSMASTAARICFGSWVLLIAFRAGAAHGQFSPVIQRDASAAHQLQQRQKGSYVGAAALAAGNSCSIFATVPPSIRRRIYTTRLVTDTMGAVTSGSNCCWVGTRRVFVRPASACQ